MRRNQIFLLAPLAAVMAFFHTTDAAACSCGKVNIDTAITASEAIAVVSIENAPSEKDMRAARTNVVYMAKVEKAFKGETKAGASQPLVTAASSAACGRQYEKGKRYVVFVGARDGNWYDNSCSATAVLDDKGQHPHLAAIEKWVADGKDLKVPDAAPKGPAHAKPVDPAAKDGTPPPDGQTPPADPAVAQDPATPTPTPDPAAPASPPGEQAAPPTSSPTPTAEKPEPASSCAAAPLAMGWPLLGLLLLRRRRR